MTEVAKTESSKTAINFATLDLSTVSAQALDRAGVRNGQSQEAMARALARDENIPVREFCARHTKAPYVD